MAEERAGGNEKGKLLVVAFVGLLLMALAAFLALIGLESGPIGNAFVPGGTTPENLPEAESAGAQVLVRHCAGCHNLPSPTLHTAEAWPYVIERMKVQMRSQVMGRRPIPSPQDEQILLDYLRRNARPPRVQAGSE